ncbi:MAG: YqgE/AlgH family protein [Alphaproteobacteria bacterium]|nr:YqgE/AlgH family protein [Alphaproteobacteria bacterium]
MNGFDEKYALTGKFLVSLPALDDAGVFGQSVVYICSHGRNGAMGVIINKRLDEFSFADLTMQLPVKNYAKLSEVSLYAGGPLEKVRGMVLHSADYVRDGTIIIGNGIAVSSTSEIISDIAFDQGPEDKLVALGYSFWAPQQLEHEIYNNDWLVIDAGRELIFRTKDEEKWQRALDESGIKLDRFVNVTGHC